MHQHNDLCGTIYVDIHYSTVTLHIAVLSDWFNYKKTQMEQRTVAHRNIKFNLHAHNKAFVCFKTSISFLRITEKWNV